MDLLADDTMVLTKSVAFDARLISCADEVSDVIIDMRSLFEQTIPAFLFVGRGGGVVVREGIGGSSEARRGALLFEVP